MIEEKRRLLMTDRFYIVPVGVIKKRDDSTWIEIFERYTDALLGLDEFSHITVCYWFHENDHPDERQILQVHPRKDEKNPLRGVFATHSPVRPNLIAVSICQILSIQGNTIHIDEIDAFDGSPVIDVKCFIPSSVATSEIKLPDWVQLKPA
jgi:tRNA-Thr(GGU) m(6)t(6)A37 methyltransferase TsaA